MIEGIKAIIFDLGGVLIDAETKEQFPESKGVLEYCKAKGYRMALAVIASKLGERQEQIANSDLHDFFEIIRMGSLTPEQIWDPSFKGKDILYDEINRHLKLSPKEVLIIDDRILRGITYANRNGHPSVWIQKGKFSKELPNQTTGYPTHTIHSLKELTTLI